MLSKKTKYAIKALVALAKAKKDSPFLRIVDIAEKEKIPRKFLESILLDLRKHGILGSKMGVNGGYYLLKKPSEIMLTEIIRVTGGPIAMVRCVSLNFYEKCDDCKDEVTCGLRKIMLDLRDANLKILSANSIMDIVKKEADAKPKARK